MWCRVHRDPWWKWNHPLLWSADGIKEVNILNAKVKAKAKAKVKMRLRLREEKFYFKPLI